MNASFEAMIVYQLKLMSGNQGKEQKQQENMRKSQFRLSVFQDFNQIVISTDMRERGVEKRHDSPFDTCIPVSQVSRVS